MIQSSSFTVSYFDKKVIVFNGELIRLWSTLDGTESIQDFQSHKGIMKDLLNLRLSMTDYSQTNYRDVQGVPKKRTFKIFKDMSADQIVWLFLVILSKYHCSRHFRPFFVFLVILAHFFISSCLFGYFGYYSLILVIFVSFGYFGYFCHFFCYFWLFGLF